MCVVSAVMPQVQTPFLPYMQQNTYVPPEIAKLAKDVKDVLERLDRIDKALGLKDCKETEADKQAFLKKLSELAEHAKKL